MWSILIMRAHATTWVVDPSGAGDALTITDGVALAADGDTVEIRAGTYYESDVYSSSENLTIRGDGAETTILDGSLSSGTTALRVPATVSLDGLTVQHHGEAIGLAPTSTDDVASIDGCTFIDNEYGIFLYGTSLVVRDSLFVGQGHWVILPYVSFTTILLENSVFVDNADTVSETWDLTYDGPDRRLDVHHNVFINSGTIHGQLDRDTGTVSITNNIFLTTDIAWSIGVDYAGEILNNLVGTAVTMGLDGVWGTDVDVADNLIADPVFVAWSDDGDWTNDDLRLVGGSPGVDLGVSGYASVTEDRDGVTRPVDGDGDGSALPDAGPYEYDPTYDTDGDGYSTWEDADCDDADPGTYPTAPETWYDGIDQDCDGADDDQDGDGYLLADDCDDTDATVYPSAAEIWYDGIDQDCDGTDDDQDGDGYLLADDCDDTDAAVFPSAAEIWYDGIDQDCDGADDDQDGDGYLLADDCDDTDASVHPAATEIWYDGIDQDCDGADDDQDGDGYLLVDDCDDTDANVYPSATETWYDGIDQDCDGADDDQDGDGYLLADDCDDTDAAVFPSAAEIWYDGIDQNCDGADDDQDGDGYLLVDDCDDADATVSPGGSERCGDSVDQDCDGVDLACPDTGRDDTGRDDTGDTDTEAGDTGGASGQGCGACAAGPGGPGGAMLLVALGLTRRRGQRRR